MKKTLLTLCACLLSASAIYADNTSNFEPLNKISMTFSAQQWATANTAKVSVVVNAALTEQQLANFQQKVQTHLQQLAPSKGWHIVSFNQAKGSSGLQNVTVLAQARLPSHDLANLSTNAERLNAQGVNYKIATINFSPSFAQIQATKSAIRQTLYKQIQTELKTINQTYAPQTFHVYNITFQDQSSVQPRPLPITSMVAYSQVKRLGDGGMNHNTAVQVNQQVKLSAQVQFANMGKDN